LRGLPLALLKRRYHCWGRTNFL